MYFDPKRKKSGVWSNTASEMIEKYVPQRSKTRSVVDEQYKNHVKCPAFNCCSSTHNVSKENEDTIKRVL